MADQENIMEDQDNVADSLDETSEEGSAILADSAKGEKDEERKRIHDQIEEFLKNGGKIDHIDPNVMADPPKKPTSNYGGQPI